MVTAVAVDYLALNVSDKTFGAVFVGIIALQGLRMPERGAAAKPRPQPTRVDDDSLLSIFDKPQQEEPWR